MTSEKKRLAVGGVCSLMAFILMTYPVDATTIELLEHTDRCDYNEHLDIDHCFSKYLVCDNETDVKSVDISFIFKERGKDFLSVDGFGDKLDTEIEYEKKEACLEVSITGWKNKFIDVDNVLCHNGYCAYEFAWWNSSMTRSPIISIDNATGTHYINDSYGVDSGTGIQHIACYIDDWTETAYAYNDTNDIWYCANSTTQFNSFVDEGNGTDYGNPEESLQSWYQLGDMTDSSIYDNNATNHGMTLVNGQIGHAYDADGSSTYMDTNNMRDIYIPGTLSLWLKCGASSANDRIIAAYDGSKLFTFLYGSGSFYRLDIRSPTQVAFDYETATAGDGNWHMIIVTWNDTFQDWWYDGNDVSETLLESNTQSSFTLGYDVFIGARNNQGNPDLFSNCTIDDVRLYNISLSDNYKISLYNNTHPDGYWPLGTMETYIPPPPPPIPVTSFIVYKIINSQIPFIGGFLESLTFKSIILFMDRLTVIGNAVIGGNVDVGGSLTVNDSVGIGTTNPHTLLDIHRTDDPAVLRLTREGSFEENDRVGRIQWSYFDGIDDDVLGRIAVRRNGSADAGVMTFGLQTADGNIGERMRINSTGEITIKSLDGGDGSSYVCVDDNGVLFSQEGVC